MSDSASSQNIFEIHDIISGKQYICEMCHELSVSHIANVKFKNSDKPEIVYMNYNEVYCRRNKKVN